MAGPPSANRAIIPAAATGGLADIKSRVLQSGVYCHIALLTSPDSVVIHYIRHDRFDCTVLKKETNCSLKNIQKQILI